MEKAAGLDKFYIPTRYPNGLPDLTPGQVYLRSDAEAGIAMASFLLDAARGMLAAEHKTPIDGNDTDEAEANPAT
jgi:HEPN domain-containing protein